VEAVGGFAAARKGTQNALNEKARLLYVVFDALFMVGKDIREKPLLERKKILKALLPRRAKARCVIRPSLGCAPIKKPLTSSANKHETLFAG
jgi:ATP-dependent DNA ligase